MPDLPWEVAVLGVPASLQAKTTARQGWKSRVADRARATWDGPPLDGTLRFEMFFYYEGRRPDVDNIIKYTQDGLSGIVYTDDAVLLRTSSEVLDLNGEYVCRGMSPATAAGFVSGMPFVVVRVYEVEKRRRLP